MKDITVCPSTLKKGHNTYCPAAIKVLFEGKEVSHILSFSLDDDEEDQNDMIEGKISVSGVQEKLSAVIDGKMLRLTRKGEQGQYIIKPAPAYRLRFRHHIPANEHLTMQIAKQVYGIQTAENGIIFFSDGRPAYITKRFDVLPDNSKTAQEDFASLICKTAITDGKDFKYSGSYEDIAIKIKEIVSNWQVEIEYFYNLILFNYLFSNGDAHLKNFSLQATADGDYMLTPAYDLMDTSIHTDDTDFALEKGLSENMEKSDTYIRTGHPCEADFINFGKLIGIPENRIDNIIRKYSMEQPQVEYLVESSFLGDKQKRMYLQNYKTRLDRFRRKDID
ncbi:type II toxin-antitoxin system HipA family toxin [Bacteroides sp. 519]|uniref:type II toxin-antitoxin system HipA family toxin n=1 Tax=Bacteroides sp. 519 TaxID=2302937 RepID=UPI0013D15054|nr:HipA domain-containing protein [Bacteroides sp. 519]NDV58483.1 type II toxin-antitoxin system HipA family toxin [Bacteroides sp. 519]